MSRAATSPALQLKDADPHETLRDHFSPLEDLEGGLSLQGAPVSQERGVAGPGLL